jgi:hypothetical protein
MANEPLIDPFQIDKIMRDAKIQRIHYLHNKIATGAGAARWSGLTALVASCLALFVSHSTASPQSATDGDSNRTISHTD